MISQNSITGYASNSTKSSYLLSKHFCISLYFRVCLSFFGKMQTLNKNLVIPSQKQISGHVWPGWKIYDCQKLSEMRQQRTLNCSQIPKAEHEITAWILHSEIDSFIIIGFFFFFFGNRRWIFEQFLILCVPSNSKYDCPKHHVCYLTRTRKGKTVDSNRKKRNGKRDMA